MENRATKAANDTFALIQTYVPSLIGAVVLLIVGWFLAAWIARIVQRGLVKTRIGSRVASAVAEEESGQARTIESWISRSVFWLLMLFVFVGFFQVLGVSQVTEPITRFLNRIF